MRFRYVNGLWIGGGQRPDVLTTVKCTWLLSQPSDSITEARPQSKEFVCSPICANCHVGLFATLDREWNLIRDLRKNLEMWKGCWFWSAQPNSELVKWLWMWKTVLDVKKWTHYKISRFPCCGQNMDWITNWTQKTKSCCSSKYQNKND